MRQRAPYSAGDDGEPELAVEGHGRLSFCADVGDSFETFDTDVCSASSQRERRPQPAARGLFLARHAGENALGVEAENRFVVAGAAMRKYLSGSALSRTSGSAFGVA